MREVMLVNIIVYFIIASIMFIYLIYNTKILIGRRQEFIKVDYKLEPGTFRQTGKSWMASEAVIGNMMDDWIQSINSRSMRKIWKMTFIFSCYTLYCCILWILSEYLENNVMYIFYISLVPVVILVIGLMIKDIMDFFKSINFIKMRFFKIKNSREIMSELSAL